MSNFVKFRLLLWKNWIIQSRHPIQTLFELLLPILLTLILVLVRSEVEPSLKAEAHYADFEATGIRTCEVNPLFVFNKTVAFSPNTNDIFEKISEKVANSLNYSLVGFKNSADLETYLIANNPYVGIEFSNVSNENLDYALRFQSDYHSSWHTDKLFDVNKETRAPRNTEPEGGEPYYDHRCFLLIQDAVDRAFIGLSSSKILPSVKFQRFAYPAYLEDLALSLAKIAMPAFILISFLYTCKNIIKCVALEKENQLKEAMKIVGLPNWLHHMAWLTKCLIFIMISFTAMTFLLTSSHITLNSLAPLGYSNPILLWIFFLCFSISFITFCFFVSVLFNKATTAANYGYFFWCLTYLPFNIIPEEIFFNLNIFLKMLTCLLNNTAMGNGLVLITTSEVEGVGLQWYNLFSGHKGFSVGLVMIMFLISAVLYMLLTLYIEKVFPGEYGIPEKWYFPIAGLLTRFKYNDEAYDPLREKGGSETSHTNANFENEPMDKKIGVKIKGLHKRFGNKNAVNGLNLNMYEDQITVLLGHNGAGKTTTMSMLTGMFPPTSGTAIIDGKDLTTNIDGVRESLGLCPQHNILFDELTVKEHIIFFSSLKGMKGNELKEEIRKYVDLLGLTHKMNKQSHTLSGGMKRKLSVGIALCGNSKVVLIDEASSGMDPAARRSLWDLLQEVKHGRTILLSTHFMDEADVLGDRIAIMAEGELQAVGSSYFLKKRFGVGYRMVCAKEVGCNTNDITAQLKSYVNDVELESDIGTEVTFILNQANVQLFKDMLESFENNMKALRISSYGISLTTMEEVFLKVGVNAHALHSNNHDQTDGRDFVALQTGEEYGASKLTGSSMVINQVIAMLKKKFLYTLRKYKPLILMLILCIFLLVSLKMNKIELKSSIAPMKISWDQYQQTTAIVANSDQSPISDAYFKLFDNPGHYYETVPKSMTIDAFILKKYNESYSQVNRKYIFGVTFNPENVTVSFNNEAYHALPLTLNALNNAILRWATGKTNTITVTNKPYNFIKPDDPDKDDAHTIASAPDIMNALVLSIIYSYFVLYFAQFYIKERVCRAKLLQMISGVNKLTFWFSSFAFDYIIYLVVTVLLVGILASFQDTGTSTFTEVFRIFLILGSFGLAALPLHYLASYIFNKPSTSDSLMFLFNLITGLVLFGIYFLFSNIPKYEQITKILYWFFLVLPTFSLMDALIKLMFNNTTRFACLALCGPNSSVCDISTICQLDSKCCVNYFGFTGDGISPNLIAFLLSGILYMSIVLVIEYHIFQRLLYKIIPPIKLPALSDDMDSDVKEEAKKINSMAATEVLDHNLVMQKVTKKYGNSIAVNQLSVGINEAECFGLLGVNGAGKTSTFKMLTGDCTFSAGDALVEGYSCKTQIELVHKRVGYCPQFDALLEDLTGRETLEIFCLLRGIPRSQIKKIYEQFAEDLGFTEHLDKKSKAYSGGTKRKLSTALALIGEPKIIFLDEPSTGLDPKSKRNLWDIVSKTRSSGTSIVLTSHSMEECEALCTRLAIMVNGEFKCLGSTQHLKNKFSRGFVLTIKVSKEEAEGDHADYVNEIKEFVKYEFPISVLKEEYLDILTYHVESSDMKWSVIFGAMEGAKSRMHIDDYSMGQMSLEQVFLLFTKSSLMTKKNE